MSMECYAGCLPVHQSCLGKFLQVNIAVFTLHNAEAPETSCNRPQVQTFSALTSNIGSGLRQRRSCMSMQGPSLRPKELHTLPIDLMDVHAMIVIADTAIALFLMHKHI